MRRYVAVAIGWFAGLAVGIAFTVRHEHDRPIIDGVGHEFSTADLLRMAAELWGIVLVCCVLGAASAMWLIRSNAGRETGIAAVSLVLGDLVLLRAFEAAFGSRLSGDAVMWTSLTLLAVSLVAARWLGVAWHRRRTPRASGDG